MFNESVMFKSISSLQDSCASLDQTEQNKGSELFIDLEDKVTDDTNETPTEDEGGAIENSRNTTDFSLLNQTWKIPRRKIIKVLKTYLETML